MDLDKIAALDIHVVALALGLAMLRSMLEADPARGIPALIRLALPALTGGER